MWTAELAAGAFSGLETDDGYLVPNLEFFRNGVSVFDGMKVPLECRLLAQTSWKT